MKNIEKINKAKQKREKNYKRVKNSFFPLYECYFLKEDQKKFIEDNFDE